MSGIYNNNNINNNININNNDIININNSNNIKNVIDLGLNQNKYLVEPDKGCLFTAQTTFKIQYSPQISHVLTCREYTKSVEQLNSTIEPLLSSFKLNNLLFLFILLFIPSIIVTAINASLGKLFLPSVIIGGISFLIIIFAIFRKSFLHRKLVQGISRDIRDFNKRFQSRQVLLEYLVTTKFNQKNGREYSISLHLIYPIITLTPGMFSINQEQQQQQQLQLQQQNKSQELEYPPPLLIQQQQTEQNYYDEEDNSNENSSLLRF
ncbi:hypothetical protein ACTFIY_006878 [Dictyostelium cf. discoideum]